MENISPDKLAQIQRLVESNSEFRKLFHEHRLLGEQVEEMTSRKHLSDDEIADLARLKKMKLEAKDRMSQILFDDELASQ